MCGKIYTHLRPTPHSSRTALWSKRGNMPELFPNLSGMSLRPLLLLVMTHAATADMLGFNFSPRTDPSKLGGASATASAAAAAAHAASVALAPHPHVLPSPEPVTTLPPKPAAARVINAAKDVRLPGWPGLNVTWSDTRSLRIVVVANGKTVLGKGKGAQVDGHDLVVRFNYFRTAGFEKDVGRRTDLWFLGELKEPGPRGTRGSLGARSGTMNLRIRPKLNYMIPIVFPTPAKCVKLRSLEACVPSKGDLKYRKSTVLHLQKMYGKYKLLPQVKFLTIDLERMLQVKYGYVEKWPSSGILAIVYLLEAYPKARVSVHGYDFGGQGLGHYWEKFLKKTTVHAMGREKQFIDRLVSMGRVVHL